jgi:hypothetical protein
MDKPWPSDAGTMLNSGRAANFAQTQIIGVQYNHPAKSSEGAKGAHSESTTRKSR